MNIAARRNDVLINHLPGTDVRPVLRNGALALGGSLLLAASAQATIPMVPVPITLQSFAVLVIGMTFGSRLAVATVLLYLAEGASGLPVFAGGAGGISRLLGMTGGYLVGFAIAAGLMGLLAERGWDRKLLPNLAAQTIGTLVILVCGAAWLATFVGMKAAIATGFTPFLIGSVLKIGVATAVLPAAWQLLGRRDRR